MTNKTVYISRGMSRDVGIFSSVKTDFGFKCMSAELPWKDNKTDLSCIPEGTYEAEYYYSVTRGDVYRLKDVPGRTSILIHAGNWAGDVEKGMRSDSEGCVLFGNGIAFDGNNQMMITNSRKTMKEFIEATGKEGITIIIRDFQKASEMNTPWGGR